MSKKNNENKNSWVTVFIYPEGNNGAYLHDSKESAVEELKMTAKDILDADEEYAARGSVSENSDWTYCEVYNYEEDLLATICVIPVYGEESEDFKKGGGN